MPNKSALVVSETGTAQDISPDQVVKYSDLKAQILSPNCFSCHSDVQTEAGLSKWVTPGNPEQSLLFTRVEDGTMPKNARPLTTQQLEIIRNYINQLVVTPTPVPNPSPSPVPVPGAVTFAQISSQVLVPYNCARCHSVGTEAQITKWINTTSPDNSLLYTRVKDGTMPQGGSTVTAAKQALLLQYVRDFSASH